MKSHSVEIADLERTDDGPKLNDHHISNVHTTVADTISEISWHFTFHFLSSKICLFQSEAVHCKNKLVVLTAEWLLWLQIS